jgi:uncharacterized protein YpuA (DUF1002 family)
MQHVTIAVAGGGVVIATIAAVGLLMSAPLRSSSPPPVAQPAVAVSVGPAVASPVAVPAPSGAVVYGGDLTDEQRADLGQLFGAAADNVATDTVSRAELVSTLRSAGLPVDGSERAISSVLVACQPVGAGLRVHTVNITDIPAAAYANALVTAGISDASVVVAAPSNAPVTGETALVGVLRAYPALPWR